MTESVQSQYEIRLRLYAGLIHGTNQFGLLAKLQMYQSFLEKHRERGDNLWKIEPLMYYLLKSLEQDVHLTLAKFFDDSGYGIIKFLDFCLSSRKQIQWNTGNPPSEMLFKQKQSLAAHSNTIFAIKKRRDKFFAHRDKAYFGSPDQIFDDYPLSEEDVETLANVLIALVAEHENGLHPGQFSFHVSEFFEIAVDNMIRNLETGRKINFPGQTWD